VPWFASLIAHRIFASGPAAGQHSLRLVDSEADFDGYLPVVNLVLLDAPASFDNLEPAKVLNCLAGTFERGVDGVLDALG